MNQNLKLLQESEECVKQCFFRVLRVGKPLDQIPAAAAVKGTADQVKGGVISGKAGGFNIKNSRSSKGPIRSNG